MNRPAALAASAVYVGTIAAANYLTARFGLVPAGFGLLVTAGTYAAGLALGARDVAQRLAGVPWVLGCIVAGGLLSWALAGPRLALASTLAFLLGELLDLAVYTPLERRSFRVAVLASNTAGALVDTVVFLTLAGFPVTWQTVGGQLLVKIGYMTVGVLLIAEGLRRALPRPTIDTARA